MFPFGVNLILAYFQGAKWLLVSGNMFFFLSSWTPGVEVAETFEVELTVRGNVTKCVPCSAGSVVIQLHFYRGFYKRW